MTDLATVAAFTAAGFSILNVGLQARFTSRQTSQAWARDQGFAAITRTLRAARVADETATAVALAKGLGMEPTTETLSHLDDLTNDLVESLDELAPFVSSDVTEVGSRMWREAVAQRHFLSDNPDMAEAMRNPRPITREQMRELALLRREFLQKAKRELGIHEPQRRWRRRRA